MTESEFIKIKTRLKEQTVDLDEAMLLLSTILKSGKVADFLIVFRAKRETIREGQWAGHITFSQRIEYENALRHGLLELIERLRIEDFKEHIEIKILVISPDETAQADMRAYFAKLPLNATIEVSSNNPSTTDYHLLVLDNRALPDLPIIGRTEKGEMITNEVVKLAGDDNLLLRNHFQWMKDTLSETSKYAVHLGEQNFLVNKYREKMHAANSKFALYARIREVLDYMRDTQKSILKPN